MNGSAAERRRIRRSSIVQQLQERNQGIEDTLERLQIELNLNRQIIHELLTNDGDIEEYSTSVGSLETTSIEIIPSLDRKLRARATAVATPMPPVTESGWRGRVPNGFPGVHPRGSPGAVRV